MNLLGLGITLLTSVITGLENDQLDRGSSATTCNELMNWLFSNKTEYQEVEIQYEHDFFLSKVPDQLDLLVSIYLNSDAQSVPEVHSVGILIPENLQFSSSDHSESSGITAFLLDQDNGKTVHCSEPFKSYLLVKRFTPDQSAFTDGLEFAVTNLPVKTNLEIYARMDVGDSNMVHRRIEIPVPAYPSEQDSANTTNVTMDYVDELQRFRRSDSILSLRRGSHEKKPSGDAKSRGIMHRGSINSQDEPAEDEMDPPSLLKPSGKGLYEIDAEASAALRLKKAQERNASKAQKARARKAEGASARRLSYRPNSDNDGQDGVTYLPSSARKLGAKKTDVIEDKTMAGAYKKREALEYVIGASMMYDNCGKNFTCVAYPDGCISTWNCYMSVALGWKGDEVHLVLGGATVNWVAVGFSFDGAMGNDAVFICRRIPGSRKVSIWQGYNKGSDAYTSGTVIHNEQDDVVIISGGIYNGLMTCDLMVSPQFKTEDGTEFDLEKDSYYVLLALGVSTVDTTVSGGIQVHDYSIVSAERVLVGDRKTNEIVPPATHYVISIHEYLATFTFGFLMPVGILFGRYGQAGFNCKIFGEFELWFCVHVLLEGLGTLCNLINFFVILIGRAGSAYARASSIYHAVVGLLVFLACFANPGIGVWMFLQRRKGNPVPQGMRWAHWALGHFGHLFGAIELIRAAYLRKSFIACSFAVVAGYLFLFYAGGNLLLVFNTELLRQKQQLSDVSWKSFIGPTVRLKQEDVPEAQYSERKFIMIFTSVILFVCSICLIVQISISTAGCGVLSDDYI